MNPNMCETRPKAAPDEIEWHFPMGSVQIVAHVPVGNFDDSEAFRLDVMAPADPKAREMVRALLRLAQANLDRTEPTTTNAAVTT